MKESFAIPTHAWTDPEDCRRFEAPRISSQSAQIGGKIVSSRHRPLLPQEILLVLILKG